MNAKKWLQKIHDGAFDRTFRYLYGDAAEMISRQRTRYADAIKQFTERYPAREDIRIFSAPGRTEIGGNHTDHQHGCVLAAAVNLDVIAVVAFHHDGVIRLKSKGYRQAQIDVSDLQVHPDEKGMSVSLIRGICAKFAEMGVEIGGFDAYATSDVIGGSGLSSSAAFEVLIGTILDLQYNHGNAGAVEIAKIGQYAENFYFGKGSGLMDQTVSAVGGCVYIDFQDTKHPQIKRYNADFEAAGFCLCITDTKGSHSDLTEDYVAVPREMQHIAEQFDRRYLRDVRETDFYAAIPQLRKVCSDRAILRAAHFFGENRRAALEAEALESQDMPQFFALVRESGDSSANLLQNLYSCQKPAEQGLSLGIMMSKRYRGGCGAVRVHGGGFAGTIQAFVPTEQAVGYAQEMNRIFGDNSCYLLRIRPVGGVEITEG